MLTGAADQMDGGGEGGGIHSSKPCAHLCIDGPGAGEGPAGIDHGLEQGFPAAGGFVGEDDDADAIWCKDAAAFRHRLSHFSLKISLVFALNFIHDAFIILRS